MLIIHFPAKTPIKYLRVLRHAPFSSVEAITWVTLRSQFLTTVTPDNLFNVETSPCKLRIQVIPLMNLICSQITMICENYPVCLLFHQPLEPNNRALNSYSSSETSTAKWQHYQVLLRLWVGGYKNFCILEARRRGISTWSQNGKFSATTILRICWSNLLVLSLILDCSPATSHGSLELACKGHNITKLS